MARHCTGSYIAEHEKPVLGLHPEQSGPGGAVEHDVPVGSPVPANNKLRPYAGSEPGLGPTLNATSNSPVFAGYVTHTNLWGGVPSHVPSTSERLRGLSAPLPPFFATTLTQSAPSPKSPVVTSMYSEVSMLSHKYWDTGLAELGNLPFMK